jgi:hypothetical protein
MQLYPASHNYILGKIAYEFIIIIYLKLQMVAYHWQLYYNKATHKYTYHTKEHTTERTQSTQRYTNNERHITASEYNEEKNKTIAVTGLAGLLSCEISRLGTTSVV